MPRTHATTLRALAALLAYPDDDLRAALPEIAQALRAERRWDARQKAGLQALVDELGLGDLLDVQAPAAAPEDLDRDWEERPAFEPPEPKPLPVTVHRVKQATD